MIRQLLTLLAVLTGLTTVVAPAHAMHAGVQAVEVTQDAGTCNVHSGVLAMAAHKAMQRLDAPQQRRECTRPTVVVTAPPVMMQVDRARE